MGSAADRRFRSGHIVIGRARSGAALRGAGALSSEKVRLLLATRNRHKAREIHGLLARPDIEFVLLHEAGLAEEASERDLEAYATFEENALVKARAFRARTGLPTLADDSGLCVDVLDGAPGTRSRRFAPGVRLRSADEQDQANNVHLLRLLDGVPEARRTAHYRCAMALVAPAATVVAVGRVSGRIAREERGEHGFGYDPLFIVPEFGETFGELPPAVKKARSHRARAVHSLRPWLDALWR